MISKTDQQLIIELQKDGRASYTDLAAKLGITPATAAKRVEGLLASKIIDIRAVQNPFKLGLTANALIAIKADPAKIEDLCNQFVDHFYVNNVMTVFGPFDMLILVFFPTWEMLFEFIHKELSQLAGVMQYETFQIREIKKRSHQPVDDASRCGKAPTLKEIDWQLIRELAKDGRMNISELSERVGTHISTVSRRIAALTKDHIVKIQAIPNPSKFGTTSNAILVLDVDPNRIDPLCDELLPCPEVHLMLSLFDRSGVILGIETANNEILYRFIKKKIGTLPGIFGVQTFIRGEIKKRFYAWFLETKED
jgi:Lrp/AsnC family transcriptional regulator for asnA, asnC and gidA